MTSTGRAMCTEETTRITQLEAENARLLANWSEADALWIAAKAEVERLSRRLFKLERAVCDVAIIDDFYGPGGRRAKAEAALATDEESNDG